MIRWISISVLFLLFVPGTCWAQRIKPDVPSPDVLETEQDFEAYEDLSLQIMEWVCYEPWSGNESYVEDARVFCLKWLMGTPTLTIEVDAAAMKYTKKNQNLFAPFIFGLALGYRSDPATANNHALGVLYDCYRRNESVMIRDKKIEKLSEFSLDESIH